MRVCHVLTLTYDTEKSSADRVEAEAREKTPMPKLKIHIAPCRNGLVMVESEPFLNLIKKKTGVFAE